jgi:4-hydroxybenzoate polyprenyltransferase
MLICQELDVEFSWQEMALLGLSVWTIYTIDHILDGRKSDVGLMSERRMFHRSHLRLFLTLVGLAMVCAVGLLFFVSIELIVFGAGLAILSSGYFLFGTKIPALKEFSGALVYAVGVSLIPLIRSAEATLFPMFLLFLLASLNLVLFSYLDRHVDKREGMTSCASQFGARNTRTTIVILIGFLAIATCYFVMAGGALSLTVFFVAGLFIHSLIFLNSWFHDLERFKLFGDLTFVLSGVLLIM